MNPSSLLASQSYGVTQTRLTPEPSAKPRPEEEVPSFFAQYATQFVDTVREGETTAQAALVGKADTHSVVQALAASELAIQTAVTMRDKIVEAYQEILRMPV